MPPLILCLNLSDLFTFGMGYNPAIPLAHHFPSCPVTDFLRLQPGEFRTLVLGEEFPPNVLTAYGIADVRNYDALECRSTLELAQPLWGANETATSTRLLGWPDLDPKRLDPGVLDRLNVRYVIADRDPPAGWERFCRRFTSGKLSIFEVAPSRRQRPGLPSRLSEFGFRWGLAGSLLGVLLWLACWVGAIRRRSVRSRVGS
jgi:hypothetical protein